MTLPTMLTRTANIVDPIGAIDETAKYSTGIGGRCQLLAIFFFRVRHI
jgi:hypothetical protein